MDTKKSLINKVKVLTCAGLMISSLYANKASADYRSDISRRTLYPRRSITIHPDKPENWELFQEASWRYWGSHGYESYEDYIISKGHEDIDPFKWPFYEERDRTKKNVKRYWREGLAGLAAWGALHAIFKDEKLGGHFRLQNRFFRDLFDINFEDLIHQESQRRRLEVEIDFNWEPKKHNYIKKTGLRLNSDRRKRYIYFINRVGEDTLKIRLNDYRFTAMLENARKNGSFLRPWQYLDEYGIHYRMDRGDLTFRGRVKF